MTETPQPQSTPHGTLSLTDVEAVARAAHASQTDKAGRPYTEHLSAVAEGYARVAATRS